jgi:hypothetical protein
VESTEEMKGTIRFAESLRPHGVQYNILDYLPGTPLWNDLKAQGLIGEDDWRSNHRVYEFFPEHASKEELEDLVNEGYSRFVGSWETGSGLLELLRTLMVNPTARSLFFRNLTNPAAQRLITDGLKEF